MVTVLSGAMQRRAGGVEESFCHGETSISQQECGGDVRFRPGPLEQAIQPASGFRPVSSSTGLTPRSTMCNRPSQLTRSEWVHTVCTKLAAEPMR